MQIVSVEELVTQKILPFDLYNESGEKIFSAGEVLTPGKLLQLRYISVLYREDEAEDSEYSDDQDDMVSDGAEFSDVKEKKKKESRDESEHQSRRSDESYENEISCIPVRIQKDIKSIYQKAHEASLKEGSTPNVGMYCDARDKIVEEVLPIVDDVLYKSELRVFGDYDYSHGVNVSILSTVLAHKLRFNEAQIRDIALGAMLHDVGKTRIPKEILNKSNPTQKEQKLIQLHPQIGYKILKKEMGLPESIAKIALEHHERNDGSGYPYGISGDLISLPSQIIIVCDIYDALISNRGHVKVKNSKEAIKVMMELGSKWFTPNVLYTFVHMSNFNDTTPVQF